MTTPNGWLVGGRSESLGATAIAVVVELRREAGPPEVDPGAVRRPSMAAVPSSRGLVGPAFLLDPLLGFLLADHQLLTLWSVDSHILLGPRQEPDDGRGMKPMSQTTNSDAPAKKASVQRPTW